jgi:hypothetical protein
MKLRTEFNLHFPVGGGAFLRGDFEELEHDAAAAHALMLAMESVWDKEPDIFRPAIEMVEKRANALMAEWGFDIGEDA